MGSIPGRPQEILPVGMTPEMLSGWLRDNPKGDRADAIHDYILYVSERDAKPVREVLAESYPQLGVRGVFGAQPPNLMNRMSQPPVEQPLAPQGHPWRTIDPAQGGTAADVGRGLAEVGLGMAGPIASRIGSGALGLGGRLLSMAGVGAGAGAAAESLPGGRGAASGAMTGGLTGLAGQALGETAQLVKHTLSPKFWRTHWANTVNRAKWAREDSNRAMIGVLEDIPAFTRGTRGAADSTDFLMQLTQKVDPEATRTLGRELLGDAIQGAENTVVRSLGGLTREINAPTLWRSLASEAELKAYGQVHTGALPIAPTPGRPPLGPATIGVPWRPAVPGTPGSPGIPGTVINVVPPMTVKDALAGLKELTEQAIAAGHGHSGGVLWAKLKKSRDEILSQVPPEVADRFSKALHDYSRGLTFLDALHNSKALTSPLAGGKGAAFDAEEFLDHLQAKEAYGVLPKVVDRLHNGGNWGARERITSLPRGRIYKMGESVTFAVPGIRTQRRGGFDPLENNVRGPASGLGLLGISEMSKPSSTPGSYTVE